MNADEGKGPFPDSAKQMLDRLADDLDPQTVSRLRQARQRALQLPVRKVRWLIPAAGLAMTTALIALFLWQGAPQSNEISFAMEDLELLARAEPLDFYGDLEFYSWLEEREGEG